MSKQTLLGIAEIVTGIFLVSPIDEGIVSASTFGAGATIAAPQLLTTGLAGSLLIFDGLKRL
jgi:hypothetical protein